MNTTEIKTSPGIVLIHGAAATPHIWRLVSTQLAKRLPGVNITIPERNSSGDLDTEIENLWSKCSGQIAVGVSGGATLVWELCARGCPLAGAVIHEPAAGSLVPGLLSYPGSAWTGWRNKHNETATSSEWQQWCRSAAEVFGHRLYGNSWTPEELPRNSEAVLRDYLMFSQFEPRKPVCSNTTLTIGALSPKLRYDVSACFLEHFGVSSIVIPDARHCVQLENPAGFAETIAEVYRATSNANNAGTTSHFHLGLTEHPHCEETRRLTTSSPCGTGTLRSQCDA